MARPARSITHLSDTLHLADCHDGFWLYDDTRGMNLSMSAKTKDDAFVEALTYYQERLKQVEGWYSSLKSKVDQFVEQFAEEDRWDA